MFVRLGASLAPAARAAWAAYDETLTQAIFKTLARLGAPQYAQGPCKLTGSLPFVASPAPLITCIILYLAIVAFGIWKQRDAKPRPDPAWLTALVQLHNLLLIALSAWMCASAVYHAARHRYSFWGQGFSEDEVGMGRAVYVFYVSKLYEFMDTFIMLLRGKLQQVSFLHVYHHASIAVIWWMIAYIAPGGDAWYSVALNSGVHVLMYSYYLLAASLPRGSQARHKYLWWGRYLTQLQMFQFVTMMAQAAYCYRYSPHPRFLLAVLFYYALTLLALFAAFYVRKHLRGVAAKARKQA